MKKRASRIGTSHSVTECELDKKKRALSIAIAYCGQGIHLICKIKPGNFELVI